MLQTERTSVSEKVSDAVLGQLGHSGDIQHDRDNLQKMFMYASRYMMQRGEGLCKSEASELDRLSSTVENLCIMLEKVSSLKDEELKKVEEYA